MCPLAFENVRNHAFSANKTEKKCVGQTAGSFPMRDVMHDIMCDMSHMDVAHPMYAIPAMGAWHTWHASWHTLGTSAAFRQHPGRAQISSTGGTNWGDASGRAHLLQVMRIDPA